MADEKKIATSKVESGDIRDQDAKEMIPEEVPKEFRQFLTAVMRYSGPAPNPLIAKLNEEHIHKMIDVAREDDLNRVLSHC
jgi:hypothetical protein